MYINSLNQRYGFIIQVSTWSEISDWKYRTEILNFFWKLPHELKWDKFWYLWKFGFWREISKYYTYMPRVYSYTHTPRVFPRQKICPLGGNCIPYFRVRMTFWRLGCGKQMKTKGKRTEGIVFTNTDPRYAGKLDDPQGGDATMLMQQVREVMTVNQEMTDKSSRIC